jgi:D-arabinose 1-dehydrogenase-like Zn-dependent alcohol dehydrogenase
MPIQAAVKTMKAVQFSKKDGSLDSVEKEIPTPGPGQVRIKVDACGVCHSDVLTKIGTWLKVDYPRSPGHEIAGRIDETGPGVTSWKAGERVGVGWHGGHCFTCEPCRRGDFMLCKNQKITGIDFDGGYAEYVVAPAEAVARIPEGLSAEDAAPLMCAGITVFNALRHSGARAGDLVAVQGIGGLGHLAVQFASKMGFDTVAIGRGQDKEPLARQLGAREYIDSTRPNWTDALQRRGGVRVGLATAPDAKSIVELIGGLGDSGKVVMVGAPNEPLTFNASAMINRRQGLAAWASGIATDSEDAMQFAVLMGIRPMIEKFPLAKAGEAFDKMMSGKVRFRAVLSTSIH